MLINLNNLIKCSTYSSRFYYLVSNCCLSFNCFSLISRLFLYRSAEFKWAREEVVKFQVTKRFFVVTILISDLYASLPIYMYEIGLIMISLLVADYRCTKNGPKLCNVSSYCIAILGNEDSFFSSMLI